MSKDRIQSYCVVTMRNDRITRIEKCIDYNRALVVQSQLIIMTLDVHPDLFRVEIHPVYNTM